MINVDILWVKRVIILDFYPLFMFKKTFVKLYYRGDNIDDVMFKMTSK